MKLKQETKRNPLFLIVFGLSVYFIFLNFDVVLNIIKRIFSIMSPFIMGFGIAYLFYAPMMFIEDKILGKLALYENMTLKNRRKISYFLTLILFFLILFVLIFALVPELISTVEDIVDKMPQYSDNLNKLLKSKIFEQFEFIQNIDVNQLQTKAIDYIENSWRDLAGSTFTIMSSFFSSIFSFFIAFIFSSYALLNLETLQIQYNKFTSAYLNPKLNQKIKHLAHVSDEAFSGFVNGKLRESLVIIVLFFIVMQIFGFPYPLLISTMIGILTLIPWIGAFIGFGLGFLLILVIDVKTSIWFIVLFTALYQIEGNFIYPIVVGKASNLASIWIFVAGIIGGSIGGFAGIVLGIPIFSILFTLLKENVNRRLEKKQKNLR